MNETVYISLPKNISFSVFEALRIHELLLEESNKNVVYLSRNKSLKNPKIKYFNSYFNTFKFLRKQENSVLYGITIKEVLLAYLANIFGKKKPIIFWVQGLIDEEDFLSNKSKLRYYTFKKLLKFCLKVSDKIVVVTDYMFEILNSKYNCPQNKKYIVLPCKSRVKYNGNAKYKKSISYIGGLSKWQNVDKQLVFFNELCKSDGEYIFYIATFNHNDAEELIERFVDSEYKAQIKLVNVSTEKEVTDFLSKMEYGFLLRDDILLNNVASPIKLAEYLACGVNPIISDSLKDFYKSIKEHDCGVVINNNDFKTTIEQIVLRKPSTENATICYNNVYEPEGFNQKFKDFLN